MAWNMAWNPEVWLAPLTAYGIDIYVADAKGDMPLWTACSGYDTEGFKRFREVLPAVLAENRRRNRALLKLKAKRFVRKRRERGERPPGPPPPPPAVPVHSLADIIRIIQSRRDGWPAHWTLAGDCETREVTHG